MFTDYWKVLIWNFSEKGNTVIFLIQKVDGKMIFTWHFLAFHDIPGLAKFGFWCSDSLKRQERLETEKKDIRTAKDSYILTGFY